MVHLYCLLFHLVLLRDQLSQQQSSGGRVCVCVCVCAVCVCVVCVCVGVCVCVWCVCVVCVGVCLCGCSVCVCSVQCWQGLFKKKMIPLQFTEYTYALKCHFRWI